MLRPVIMDSICKYLLYYIRWETEYFLTLENTSRIGMELFPLISLNSDKSIFLCLFEPQHSDALGQKCNFLRGVK